MELKENRERKKKIAIFLHSFQVGGTERVVSILLAALTSNLEIDLVLFSGAIDFPIGERVNLHVLGRRHKSKVMRQLMMPLILLKYYRFYKRNDIEVSLSFGVLPNYLNCFLKIFCREAVVVISERSHPSERYKDKTIRNKVNVKLIQWLYPLANVIIANSKGNAHDVANIIGDERTIEVIYNPLSPHLLHEKIVDASYTKKPIFRFINVANLKKEKNQILIIEALARVKNRNFELVIVGEGQHRDVLESAVSKLNLESKVKFLGFRQNPFVSMYEADCMVLSSNYEGFPNVLIEAMALSLPVISTDCKSGPREILASETDFRIKIEDDIEICECGILVPTNNVEMMKRAMEMMIDDDEFRKTCAVRARKIVEKFDTFKIAAQYDQALIRTMED